METQLFCNGHLNNGFMFKILLYFHIDEIYMARPLTVWVNIIIVRRQICFSVKFDTVK